MSHILDLSMLIVTGLSTCNEPLIIWNSIFNEFNTPYIMPHIVYKIP